MKPPASAAVDQAAAATAHARSVMDVVAALHAGHVGERPVGPVTSAIVHRLRWRSATGRLRGCAHLTAAGPRPAYWLAAAPGQLRCAACTAAVASRIRGRDAHRCDQCAKVAPTVTGTMVQLPAVVHEFEGLAPVTVPPIGVIFGLCPACSAADEHGE